MEKNIILSILIAVFFLGGGYAFSQEWPNTATIVEKVRIGLNLTQDQFDQVKVIIQNNMIKRKKVSHKGITTMSQSSDLDTELYSELSEVLTEHQMNKWNKILELIVQDMDTTELTNSKIEPLPVNRK